MLSSSRRSLWVVVGALAVPSLACQKSSGSRAEDGSASGGFGEGIPELPETSGEGADSQASSSGSGSDSADGGAPSGGMAEDSAMDSGSTPDGLEESTPDDGGDGDDIRFDVSGGETGDEDNWGMLEPPERPDFSYIWIADSPRSTVSKIDTTTVTEVGRYYTHPNGQHDAAAGDPSRTSVSRTGDMVVANRNGGVMKVFAQESRCQDRNGGGISTSRDANPISWDQEECRAWYTSMEYDSQRAIAWTSGRKNPDGDGFVDPKVWVTGAKEGSDIIDIMLLNGDTGAIEERTTFDVGEYGGTASPYGAYGGAVDFGNNFWFASLPRAGRWLVRVDRDDLSLSSWTYPSESYGIFVDPKGRPWLCGNEVGRFDVLTETWETVRHFFSDEHPIQRVASSGCMMDAEGRVWTSAQGRLMGSDAGKINGDYFVALDWETLEVVRWHHVPNHPHGISIDFDGFVWGVANSRSNDIYKVHPDSGLSRTYNGLHAPYTYSDMTGYGIGLAQISVD